jgi:hypothetical protein
MASPTERLRISPQVGNATLDSSELQGEVLSAHDQVIWHCPSTEKGPVMTVLVPMTVDQDEDGWWCAHAQLGPNVGANGQGRTRKEAVDDLRDAVLASFEADGGIPAWLVRSDSLAVDVEVA